MSRLFVALPLPESLRHQLCALQGGIPGARWIPPENMHLTLAFLGEVDGTAARDAEDALTEVTCPAFSLTVQGIGTFENGKRGGATLWAGVKTTGVEKSDPLNLLQQRVVSAISQAGVEPERRKFKPHVSLARTKNVSGEGAKAKLQQFVEAHNLFKSDPFKVDHFGLYSSRLRAEGPLYRLEAAYALD